MAKAKKKACSGDECSAVGDAFREVEGGCDTGVGGDLLKQLVAEAARDGKANAADDCDGEGCECAGRFHVTQIGKSRMKDGEAKRCIWFVAGTFQGTCEAAGTEVKPPKSPRIHVRKEFRPETPRPTGPCGDKPCRGIASAYVTVKESPADGLDSDLMLALIDAAAAAAAEDASSRCAAGCGCNGSFTVIDTGVDEVTLHGRTRYIWWVGGVHRGKCQEVD